MLLEMGISPRLYMKRPVHDVEPRWDNKIKKQSWNRFSPESSRSSHYIFFTPPSTNQLLVNTLNNTKSILVASSKDLQPAYGDLCLLSNKVVCTSWNGVKFLKDSMQVDNAVYLPLDISASTIRKTKLVINNSVIIAMICAGWPIKQVVNDSIQMSDFLLSSYENVLIKFIMYRSMPSPYKKRFKSLFLKYPDRIECVKPGGLTDNLISFINCDLSILMSRFLNTGMLPLLSVYGGTPVIAYDVPPINEILINLKNAMVVKASLNEGYRSLPIVSNDPSNFENFKTVVTNLLTQKNSLRKLRTDAHYDLDNRRSLFENGWKRVLDI